MKNYNFFLFIFLMFSSHTIIAQTDYNKFDEKGKKNGLWKGFYEESKRPRYDGNFIHGKEIGLFNYYDDTKAGTIIATREFNANDNAAYTVFYDQNKNKVSEGKVVNRLFEGQWKYYHLASKKIMTIENYNKGKLEGLRSVFYPDGNIAEEINYKNNLKEGFYKKYTEKGIILEESIYSNNEYDGMAIFNNSAGDLVSKGLFVKGKKSGIWQFFEKGKLVREINMDLPEPSIKSKRN